MLGIEGATNSPNVCTDTTTQISTSGKTKIGNMTSGGGLAAAFDGTTSKNNSQCANTGSQAIGYVGIDWGSGITHTVTKVETYGANDNNVNGGYVTSTNPTVDITLQGSNDNFSSDINDLGSISFTDTNDESALRTLTATDTTTAYRYHRIKIDPNSSGDWTNCAECKLYGC